MRSIFWKNVGLRRDILGRSACWNRGGFGKLRFYGHFENVQGRKWRWRTLDILSDRFWNYFSRFQGNCKENGCGLGFLRILSLYRIQPPIFPHGVALFFYVALFFSGDCRDQRSQTTNSTSAALPELTTTFLHSMPKSGRLCASSFQNGCFILVSLHWEDNHASTSWPIGILI